MGLNIVHCIGYVLESKTRNKDSSIVESFFTDTDVLHQYVTPILTEPKPPPPINALRICLCHKNYNADIIQ